MTQVWADWQVTAPLSTVIPVLVVSHLAVWLLARKVTIRVMAPRLLGEKVTRMSPRRTWRSLDKHGRIAVVSMICGALLIGMGLQQFMFQRSQKALIGCVQDWGGDLIATSEARSSAAIELDNAQQTLDSLQRRKERALDEIVNVVILARQHPPRADESDFTAALASYARAKNLVDAQVEVVAQKKRALDHARKKNQYPEPPALVCD